MKTIILGVKGSATSGNYGHAGRPGKVGGSSPRGSGLIESKFGFQEAIVNGNDNIDAKTLAEMQKLYEPTDKQHQEVSKILGMPIGSPQIEPGMRFAYDSTTNKWVISPDSYAHDALRSEAGPSSNEPFEFRQVTGFYDPNANKLYFYDFRDNVSGAEYLAESMGLDVRAVNRKFGAAIYAAKTNLFTANGARPSISYFNEVEGIYDKEWHVKFRYKGSSSSGNRGHAGRPGKVGGSMPKGNVPTAGYVAAKHKTDVTDLPSHAEYKDKLEQLAPSAWELSQNDLSRSVQPFVEGIFHDQGFDGKAEVVDKTELDARIAKGDIELFRGVEAKVLPELGKGIRDADYKKQVLQGSRQHADEFRDGKLFIGGGVTGSGTYTTQNRSYASGYAGDNGVIMRMALRKDAKVISASDARKLPHKNVPSAAVWGWDDGLIAAAAGYDAIKMNNMYLVLNRTALIIQRTNDYEKGLQR